MAEERVKDQLRARALDTAHCLAPRAVRCGALEVVSEFSLDSTIVHGDSAWAVVRYTIVGRLQQSDTIPRFAQAPGDSAGRMASDTIVAVREGSSWRPVRGATALRISAVLVALYFELPHDDLHRLMDAALIDETELRKPVLTDPTAVSTLPRPVRDTLLRRGCRIPQDARNSNDNIIHGSYLGADSEDWAVFCASGDTGQILVFRNAAGSPILLPSFVVRVPQLGKLPDPFEAPSLRFGCPGAIFTVGADGMRPVVRAGTLSDPDDGKLTAEERAASVHDGIGDGDCEGLSLLHYWTGTRWVVLPGAD